MEKVYNHKDEAGRYEVWRKSGLFKPGGSLSRPCFPLLSVPGDVEDGFDPGHARSVVTADIIYRRKKMQGYRVLWLAGFNAGEGVARRVVEKGVARLGAARGPGDLTFSRDAGQARLTACGFVQLYAAGDIYPVGGGGDGDGMSRQWYLKVPALAVAAVAAVKGEEVLFVPGQWGDIYAKCCPPSGDWLISCPDGGGDPIPAYYCRDCGHMVVREEPVAQCPGCGSAAMGRDRGLLVPWFGPSLWPLAPSWMCRDSADADNIDDVEPIAPGSFPPLVTAEVGHLFSRVGRMMMMGIAMGAGVPFREVLLNGRVRFVGGRKKNGGSKPGKGAGNVLKLVRGDGADALRLALAMQMTPGREIALSPSRVKGCRTFVDKTWNAARCVFTHLKGGVAPGVHPLTVPDKWIIHILNTTIEKVNDLMDNYRISHAAHLLYRFFRRQYCGWYLELCRGDLHQPGTRQTLKQTFFLFLRLLHPFMPFLTEAIYGEWRRGADEPSFLLETEYPFFDGLRVYNHEFGHVEILKKCITAVRRVRGINGGAARRRCRVYLKSESAKEKKILARLMPYFDRLTGSTGTEIVADFSGLPAGFRGRCLNWEILLPFDRDDERLAEIARLENQLDGIVGEIRRLESELAAKGMNRKSAAPKAARLKRELQEQIRRRKRIRETLDDLS